MTLIDDITAAARNDPGRTWPPAGHVERIAAQQRWQMLARNDRNEVATTWRQELAHMLDHDDVHPMWPAPKLASRIMAAFLFGEPARISDDDDAVSNAIKAWRDGTGVDLTLREGARTDSVQGEVYLRPVWDADLSPWPLLTVVPGRRVVPRFVHRVLTEAVVFSARAIDTGIVWRLLEHHHPGAIDTYAYKGSDETLGERQPLARSPWPDAPEQVETLIDDLTVVHVPFDRDGDDPHGISMFDGTEGLILGLHRLYMQEQHDSELARKRIALPSSYLTRGPNGDPRFDRTSDLLELDEQAGGTVGAESPIVPIEFSDDLVQRERIQGRIRDFMLACGIAPQTLGEQAGSAESGTARRLAQTLTVQTVGLAGGYWVHALRQAIPLTLALGAKHLKPEVALPTDMGPPAVELQDGFVSDPVEDAQVVATLDAADSISVEQKIERLHPDWPEEQKRDEVRRIKAGMATPAPPPSPSADGLAFGG